jgi:hypothetical protein
MVVTYETTCSSVGRHRRACVAAAPGHAEDDDWGHNHTKRVLLFSIDGMYAVEYLNCAHGISGVNNGPPYCPNLAALGQAGVNLWLPAPHVPPIRFPD